MSHALTPAQRAALEQALRQRLAELDGRAAARGGESRAEHAREMLLQDGDDAPQRDADREVDLATADREIAEMGAVSQALKRLQEPDYGLCTDCGASIPFARLQLEPHTLRCVACESQREKAATHGTRPAA